MGAEQVDKIRLPTATESTNLVLGAAAVLAICVTPLTHSGQGRRAYATYGPFSFMLMYGYAGFANCPAMIRFVPVWLGFLVYRRLKSERGQHSVYQGTFWPAAFFLSDRYALLVEPFVLYAFGLYVREINPPLGRFVMYAAHGTFVMYVAECVRRREVQRRLDDAEADMAHQMRVRSGQW